MKKVHFITIVLALFMAFALSACNSIGEAIGEAVVNSITGESSADSTAKPSDKDADKDIDKDTGSGKDADNGSAFGTVKTSGATDKWPSGVYSAYGIPDFKGGKVAYAAPNDEYGYTYMQSTREEFITFVDDLLAKGFRMREGDRERLNERTWESFDIYFPDYGGDKYISIYYNFDPETNGMTTEDWDEDGNEVSFQYNFGIYICQSSYPEGWTQSNLLTAVGIPDEVMIPDNANKMVDEVEVFIKNAEPVYIMFSIEFTFDYYLSAEFWGPFCFDFARACEDASDDGKIISIFTQEAIDIDTAEWKDLSSFAYTHNGKLVITQLMAEEGYGSAISIAVRHAE